MEVDTGYNAGVSVPTGYRLQAAVPRTGYGDEVHGLSRREEDVEGL